MSPQLTLQTPLELAPAEVPHYLEQLGPPSSRAARAPGPTPSAADLATRLGRAARSTVVVCLGPSPDSSPTRSLLGVGGAGCRPSWYAALDAAVVKAVADFEGQASAEDLRGQYIDPALLMPRRLITLAPTIDAAQPQETLVAAYCRCLKKGVNCRLRRCGGSARAAMLPCAGNSILDPAAGVDAGLGLVERLHRRITGADATAHQRPGA